MSLSMNNVYINIVLLLIIKKGFFKFMRFFTLLFITFVNILPI